MKEKIEWKNWEIGLPEQFLQKGDTVLLDFTATWCITCQVNKVRVLEDEQLIDLFVEKNKGFARLLSREALSSDEQKVSENVNQFFERLELVLRQMLKESEDQLRTQAGISAQLIVTILEGNISRFIRSKFKDSPSSYTENIWKILSINIFKN